MIEPFIIGILVVLLIGQNVFWAKVCFNLTNRLMSRSYGEFIQATAKPTITPITQEEFHDPISERQANELNSMLGMV